MNVDEVRPCIIWCCYEVEVEDCGEYEVFHESGDCKGTFGKFKDGTVSRSTVSFVLAPVGLLAFRRAVTRL